MNFHLVVVLISTSLAFLGATDNLKGGWHHLDVDDPDLHTALEETLHSLKSHLLLSNENAEVTVAEVLSAESQVVSGLKYKAEVVFVTSPGDYDHPKKTQKCTVEVWRQVAPQQYDLLTHACEKPLFGELKVSGEGVLGGWYRLDNLSSQELKDLSEFFLTHLGHNSNTPVELTFSKVLDATYHVVSGTVNLVVLEFEVKNRLEDHDHDSHTVTCYFKVNQLYGHPKELAGYDCDDAVFAH